MCKFGKFTIGCIAEPDATVTRYDPGLIRPLGKLRTVGGKSILFFNDIGNRLPREHIQINLLGHYDQLAMWMFETRSRMKPVIAENHDLTICFMGTVSIAIDSHNRCYLGK